MYDTAPLQHSIQKELGKDASIIFKTHVKNLGITTVSYPLTLRR